LDLLREFKEALVSRIGVGTVDVLFGVFPLFACTGDVCAVLLTGLAFNSVSGPSTATKRDRFGEGGGRLHTATGQYGGGLWKDWTHKTSTRFGLISDPFCEIQRVCESLTQMWYDGRMAHRGRNLLPRGALP
jgi:hypothetical protein